MCKSVICKGGIVVLTKKSCSHCGLKPPNCAQTRSSWMVIAGDLLMLASVALLMLYFFLWPAIAEYKAYQQTHPVM